MLATRARFALSPDLDTPPASPPSRRARPVGHLLVAAAYAAAALVLTYPLVTRLTTELAGDSVDMWIFPWDAWWVGRSLRAGSSPFYTWDLYFPHGTSLVFHTLVLPGTAWAALLLPFMSPLTFENLLILTGLFSSALAAYALALALTDGRTSAAFLVGLIYGFTPNRLDQARAHPDCVLGVWLPLMLLGAVWLLRAPTARRRLIGATLAGGAAGLSLLSRQDYTFAGLYLLALIVLARPLSDVQLTRLRTAPWLAVAALAALAVSGPYVAFALGAWPPPAPPGGYAASYPLGAVSAEAFVVPPPVSTIWSGLSAALDPGQTRMRAGRIAFLGYGVIALLAWGALASRRDRAWWFWTACGLLFAILSCGPTLLLWRQPTGVSLPYLALPAMALVRAPDRLVPAAVLCFAIAIGLSWARLAQLRPAAARWLTAPLAVLLILDLAMVPFPTTRPAPSPFYAQLAGSPERFGLIEVPSVINIHDTLYLFYQSIHGKPLHAGHISRLDEGTRARLSADPLLGALVAAGADSAFELPRDVRGELIRLHELGFRYAIFHKRFDEHVRLRGLNPGEAQILASVAPHLAPPAYEDDYLVAYDLRRAVSSPPLP